MRDNADVFSKHKFDLGCTDLVQVRIPTGDAKPHAEGLRSHPRAYLDAIDQEIQQMLDADVIEPACSSWNANIVCVKKRNGDVRICVDMRKLNKAHQPFIDKYPLSRIDQCMDALAGKKVFSSLDVSSSFHQVPIHPEDRHKTAFCTRRGQFQFKKLTMGFSSSPAAYSRLMEKVLCGLLYNVAVAYIDDVAIFAKNFDDMLAHLRLVFARFRDAKLKLRPSKCLLFSPEIEFCGHITKVDG